MKRYGITIAVLLAGAPADAGRPFTPASDSQVLETLPRELLAQRDGLAALSERLAASPDDPAVAAEVARSYIALGKGAGGPRCFGYARAAVDRWWDVPSAPAAVVKVRAKLKETDHDYGGALADLRGLLEREPRDVQAWVEVSNICRVTGDYDSAWRACERLDEVADGLAVLVCRPPLLAATGRAAEAYDLLTQALADARRKSPEVVPWALSGLAEAAVTLGRHAQAEAHFVEAIEIDPSDGYVRRAYADFLIDRGRAAEVEPLLRDQMSDNGALLAAAIARDKVGDVAEAERLTTLLADRFDETRLRGDRTHGRFEARFWLELRDDPDRALAVALDNWSRQKEPRDSRNVLEAALAAGRPQDAGPVVEFLTRHAVEDVTLRPLADRVMGR